jgi:hypothetical protein
MFQEVGLQATDLVKMDLWQYYGNLWAAQEKAKRAAIQEAHNRKQTILTFNLLQAKGAKETFSEFFRFEQEIEEAFSGRKDPLEADGQYEVDPTTGEKVWVYSYEGIMKLKRGLDKMNK